LEVANFPGTYPHSHTKFVVVDGKKVLGVGYNFGYLHLPLDHPSGQGYDMLDLGLQMTGPVAQDAIAAFDDMWSDADQIHCEDFHPLDNRDWEDTCQQVLATSGHVPEVLRTYLPPDGSDHAFSVYRTKDYKEADTFVAASLASAEETIDMIHVNFSLEMICMANLIFPDVCTIENALPWMDAVIEAVEKNPVKVRAIMETSNSNGLENRVGGNVLLAELERLGLRDQVELRFYNGKVHAKSTLIDGRMLIIGSQNMHYSSWGESGLTEYSLVTNAPEAIEEYQALFETKWEQAIPFEEAEISVSP
jgi:phosphatidylserine/phosphatidylglycerophosphate/cardiolipin synthase-like enzyme